MFSNKSKPLKQFNEILEKHGPYSRELLDFLNVSPKWFFIKIVNLNSIELIYKTIYPGVDISNELKEGIFYRLNVYLSKKKSSTVLNTLEQELIKEHIWSYMICVVTALNVFQPSNLLDTLLVYMKDPHKYIKKNATLDIVGNSEEINKRAYLKFLKLTNIDIRNDLYVNFENNLKKKGKSKTCQPKT